MSRVAGIVLVSCLLCASAGLSREIAVNDTVPDAAGPTFHVQFQAGLGLRVAGRPSVEEMDNPVLLTWELSGYRRDNRSPTWGLGVRAAMDDLGFRLGPKAFVRLPLGLAEGSYLQFGAAYYLLSGDGDLADSPGWSGELEVSPFSHFALSLGVESLEYSVNQGSAWDGTAGDVWLEETDPSWYVGAKADNWVGLIFTAVLFGLAGAAGAGSSGY